MATVYYALENVFPKRTDSINKQISPRLSYRKHVNKENPPSECQSSQCKVGGTGDGGLLGRRPDSPVSLIFSEPPGVRANANSEELNDRSSLKLCHNCSGNREERIEGSGTPLGKNFDNRSDQGGGGDGEDEEGRMVPHVEGGIHNETEKSGQCKESLCLRFEIEEIEKTTNNNGKENNIENIGDEDGDKVAKEDGNCWEKVPNAKKVSDDVTYDEEDQNLYGDLLLNEYRKYFNDFNSILRGNFYGGQREEEPTKSVSRKDSQNRQTSAPNHVQHNVDEKSERHDNLNPSLKILSEGIGRRILSEGMGSYELESKSYIATYGAFKPNMSKMFTKTEQNDNKFTKGGCKKQEAMSQAVSSRKINVSKVHEKERTRGSSHSSHDLSIGAAALPTHQMPDYTLRSKFKGFLNRRESSKFSLAVQLEVQDDEQSANHLEGRIKPSVRFILD